MIIKIKNKASILFFLIYLSIQVNSQFYTNNLSQFYNNYEVLNPSFIGSHEVFYISLIHRNQWIGFEGSPTYNLININWLMKNYQSGIGFSFMNVNIGSHKLNQLYLNYSFRIKADETFIAWGIKGGLMNGNYYDIPETDDPVFRDKRIGYLLPNFGLGMGIYAEKYYAGISIPEIFTVKLNNENKFILFNNPKYYYYSFLAGYKICVNNIVSFVPSCLFMYNKIFSLDFNIGTNFNYKNFFSAGVYYSYKKSINTVFLIKMNYQAMIGLSYDYLIGKLSDYMKGSIEFILSYQFKYKVNVSNPLKF